MKLERSGNLSEVTQLLESREVESTYLFNFFLSPLATNKH